MRKSVRFGIEQLRRSAAGAERGNRPFNIGLLIPTSGAIGLLGPSAYACARLARDTWNARGGLNGREVQLSVVNSSEDAPCLEAELDDMLTDHDVDAVVALSNTEVCCRISRIVARRVPVIYTPHFEGQGIPDWVHTIGETPDRQLVPALDWMHQRFAPRRWFLLGNDYCWPRRTHELAMPCIRAGGSTVVGERFVPLGERNFEPIVDEIARSGADAVLISLIGGESIHMCRAFGAAGLVGKVLRLSLCMEENAILGMGAENTEGMYVAAGYFANLDSDTNGDFKERYHNHFGERAPMLNSLSESVFEGMVHLQHQATEATRRRQGPPMRGVRGAGREPSDATRDPVFLGEVQGLNIRVIGSLDAARR